jgi:hypothetical protein
MKLALKTTWLSALRSHFYKQGQKELYTQQNNSYCCMGVLASEMGASFDLADPISRRLFHIEDVEYTPDAETMDIRERFVSFKPASLEDIGLTISQQSVLMEMNDAGYSFSYIADWIERNVDIDDEEEECRLSIAALQPLAI